MLEDKHAEDNLKPENKNNEDLFSNKQTYLGCLVILGIVILLFGGCGALFGM